MILPRRFAPLLAVACAAVPLTAQVPIPAHAALLNPTAPLQDLRFAADGDTIHTIGLTGGAFPHFVHYARSQDGGRSFPLREVPLAYLGGAATGLGSQAGVLGGLAVDGDLVLAVVTGPGTGPWLLRSADGGDHWQAPLRIYPISSSTPNLEAFVHANAGNVAVVWQESLSLWARHSSDGGASFTSAATQLDVGVPAGRRNPVRVRGIGAQLHVVFGPGTGSGLVYYQCSRDGGATWLPAPQTIASGSLTSFAATPSLLVAAGAANDPLLRSRDGGQSWDSVPVPGILPGDTVRSLAAHGNTILVVHTRGSVLPIPVLLQVSTDAGQTWLPQPFQLPMFRTATITAHAGPDVLQAHFRFQNGLPPGSALIQSDDQGVGWRLVTEAVDLGIVPLPAGALAITSTTLSLANSQWWAWVLEGHTRHGRGSPGAGAIEPQLRGEGTAGLGRTVHYGIREVVGGASLMCFWSAEPLGAMPLAGGTFFLQQLVAGRVLVVGGANGVPGAGSAAAAVAIPNDPALAGVRLAAQAVVLDPAAVGGLALTAAVETWVY